MRVQHRHIIYVQGYDPRGLAQYYRMFRTELRKFGRLYQLSATISRPQSSLPMTRSHPGPSRPRRTTGRPAPAYDFLRFEDFIQHDLAAPIWRTVFHAVWIYWRLVFGGTIARFWQANWRFATFITYPHFMLLLRSAVRRRHRLCASKKGSPRSAFPPCSAFAAAAALFVAVLGAVLKYTENRTYLLYLLSRHDLDLGILAPPAAGMGRSASTASRNISSTSPAPATPRKSSWSATVRDRSWAPKSWRAR